MKAFINVDVQECLRRVMEENTLHYKSDFEYDIRNLKNAMFREFPKRFYWMSRESGTYLFEDKHIYVTPSNANHTWLYYRNHPEEIKAFYVEVEKCDAGRPIGALVVLDYLESCQTVEQYAKPAQFVNLSFNDGSKHSFDIAEYIGKNHLITANYGPYHEIEYGRRDTDSLLFFLRNRVISDLEPYDFEQYMKDIRAERFARYNYNGDEFSRINQYDAKKCVEVGIPIYLFEPETQLQQVTNWESIENLRYNQKYMLAMRQQDKPIWDLINSETAALNSLFGPKELLTLSTCVAYSGVSLEWSVDENQVLKSLLDKIHVLKEASRDWSTPQMEYEAIENIQNQGAEQ